MEASSDTRGPIQPAADLEEVARNIVDGAIKVHQALGPGLLESFHQWCLIHELQRRGLGVEHEAALPISYEGLRIEVGYRIDMLVEGSVIVENKSVERLLPIHEAQLLTCMKLRRCRLGFLLNRNVTLMKDGIKRMIIDL
jgi:GxxExxY protein